MSDNELPEPEMPEPVTHESAINDAEVRDPEEIDAARRAANQAVVSQARQLFAEYDLDRTVRLAAFNRELDARLSSLNRGDYVDAFEAHQRLHRRSREHTRPEA